MPAGGCLRVFMFIGDEAVHLQDYYLLAFRDSAANDLLL